MVFLRFFVLLFIWLAGASVFAQDATTAPPGTAANPNPIVSLASQFFEHDYFNINAYANGVWDSNVPIVQNTQNTTNSGLGYAFGGGVSGYHTLKDGSISILYSGDYRNYQSNFFSSGTDQNLVLGFTKRLTRRWSLSVNASAGIFLYGGTYFSYAPTGVPTAASSPLNNVVPNPFSPETKYASGGVSLAYRQTRRLSYVFSGDFYLTRYTVAGAIGSTGGSGSLAVEYRLAPRTTISGSYSYSHFDYTNNAGQASINSVAGTVTHQFPDHWQASVSGGFNRTEAMGTAAVPVTFLVPQGSTQQAVGGYVLGNYDQISHFPSFTGSVSRTSRHSTLSFTGGQGVLGGGNGYYLTSKNLFINGVYSYNIERRSNISFGGSYDRISSVANAVSGAYSSTTFSANYGTTLVRYVGAFLRYDFIGYASLSPLPASKDNRISFGFNFSSKSIPMTLF